MGGIMRLKNKKTGEIVIFGEGIVDLNKIGCKNVAEMMEAGWEDYEEQNYHYWLDGEGPIAIDAKAYLDLLFEEDK